MLGAAPPLSDMPLPGILIAMLQLINDKRPLWRFDNREASIAITRAVVVFVIALTLILVGRGVFPRLLGG